MPLHRLLIIASWVGCAVPLAAQTAGWCSAGPGTAFGITAYQCASCGFETKSGQPTVYSFLAEPVVTGVEPGMALASGDVIEAVDGQPITTRAGGDAFTYPSGGTHDLVVRRGRDRKHVQVAVPSVCNSTSSSSSSSRVDWKRPRVKPPAVVGDTIHVGRGSGSGVGVGVPVLGGEPLFIIDGVVQPQASPQVGKFGFAVECHPPCSMKRASDGRYYYKYDGYPSIAVVREGSAADKAGLRVGDQVVTVNGRSILADDALNGTESRDELRMTVRRDGKDIDAIMLVVK